MPAHLRDDGERQLPVELQRLFDAEVRRVSGRIETGLKWFAAIFGTLNVLAIAFALIYTLFFIPKMAVHEVAATVDKQISDSLAASRSKSEDVVLSATNRSNELLTATKQKSEEIVALIGKQSSDQVSQLHVLTQSQLVELQKDFGEAKILAGKVEILKDEVSALTGRAKEQQALLDSIREKGVNDNLGKLITFMAQHPDIAQQLISLASFEEDTRQQLTSLASFAKETRNLQWATAWFLNRLCETAVSSKSYDDRIGSFFGELEQSADTIKTKLLVPTTQSIGRKLSDKP